MLLDSAISRLYDLNTGIIGGGGDRHERPHKPLLLLAVLDLIDEGKATPDLIPWCQALRDRFTTRFLAVRKLNDDNTPDNPFLYLRKDGFWQAWMTDGTSRLALETTPLVQNMGRVFARFTGGFEFLAAIPANRQLMREALVARYFPWAAPLLASSLHSTSNIRNPTLLVADEPPEFGRSPAFRRKILEIYDHQCAACGLRIKLPVAQDVSFIDAAHLIPFSDSHNDHPTNGLALCKNHHWAMDRNLIAPCPGLAERDPGRPPIWHVSRVLDPRRSTGERELHELSGKSLLLPKDPAFHPDEKGLRWRCERIGA